jgi:hypothetical protein
MVSRSIGLALMTRSSASVFQTDAVLRPFSDPSLTVKSGVFFRRDSNERVVEDFIQDAVVATAGLRLRMPKTK